MLKYRNSASHSNVAKLHSENPLNSIEKINGNLPLPLCLNIHCYFRAIPKGDFIGGN